MKKLIHTLVALLTFSPAFAGIYDSDTELNRLKPTEPAILVTLGADKHMSASRIKVPNLTDGKSLLCFKDPDDQLVSCFVVNVKTGEVVFVRLPTDAVST